MDFGSIRGFEGWSVGKAPWNFSQFLVEPLAWCFHFWQIIDRPPNFIPTKFLGPSFMQHFSLGEVPSEVDNFPPKKPGAGLGNETSMVKICGTLPLKTNISPEEGPFSKEFSFSTHQVSGDMLVFQGVNDSSA